MPKMTFKLAVSFDTTCIADVADFEQRIERMREELASPEKLSPTERALTGLVTQAADRSLEEGIAEMLRTGLRVSLNELLNSEMTGNSPGLTIRVSPTKVVCDGIQVQAV